jgi:hypothetical protein
LRSPGRARSRTLARSGISPTYQNVAEMMK